LLGFDVASAVLFGAVLAPTDPVLAADVQQTSPHDEGPGEVRFALTSEAGLNDALAFPFTMLALAIGISGADPANWFGHWLAVDVAYRLGVGLAAGVAFGFLLRAVVFHTPLPTGALADTGDGLVAVAGTFLTYGVTELAEGYGFLAVFVAAQVLRSYERDHEFNEVIHDFSEQVERLVNGVILVLFGGAIAHGLLDPVTPAMVVVAVALVVIVRPLVAFATVGGEPGGRAIISFFGIRGVGSLFYLAYALSEHDFGHAEQLWAAVGLTVLLSITVHGLTAGPVMHRYDRARGVTQEEVDDDRDRLGR
jgi:NhaP-type Na+/H+ or K+/H+ antiporter